MQSQKTKNIIVEKRLNIKSSTGTVHAGYLNSKDKNPDINFYRSLCNHINYYRWDGNEHNWAETEEPVTCKRCLRLLLLNEMKNNKYSISISQNSKFVSIPSNSLIKTLISQGYIIDDLKKGKQLTIIIKCK